MKYIKAKGLKGFLISDNIFRVHDEKNRTEFKDYTIVHNDLEIMILDDDAFIYENDQEEIIDYSKETLGKK